MTGLLFLLGDPPALTAAVDEHPHDHAPEQADRDEERGHCFEKRCMHQDLLGEFAGATPKLCKGCVDPALTAVTRDLPLDNASGFSWA